MNVFILMYNHLIEYLNFVDYLQSAIKNFTAAAKDFHKRFNEVEPAKYAFLL